MVKDHSDNKRGNPLMPHGVFFPIISIQLSFNVHSEQAVIARHGHTPVINWTICLGQKVSS